ncbi:MAG: APC family permease [Caldivirga sp.]
MESKRIALRRALGSIELFALGYSDVSSTYYFSMGVIALYSGSALPMVMLLGSVPLWLVGLTYAELGSSIPEAGGAYYYVRRGLGDGLGFMAGWLLNLDQIIMIAYGAVSFVGYLGVLVDVLHVWPYNLITSLAVIYTLMFLNIIGIKPSARFNLALVIVDLAGIATLISLGAYALTHIPHHLTTSLNVALPMVGLTYALRGYIGIDVIAQSAGEARMPRLSVPKSIIAICALSTAVALALSMLATYSGLVQYMAGHLSDPLGALALGLFGHGLVSMYISLSVALVMLISVNAGIVDFSRSIYKMSDDDLLPRGLSAVHRRFRTPYISIVVSSMVASLFVLTNDVELIAGSYGIASLITYMLTVIALAKFKALNGAGGFTTPTVTLRGVKVPVLTIIGLPVLAVALALVFIFKSQYTVPVAVWLIVGVVLYSMRRLGR